MTEDEKAAEQAALDEAAELAPNEDVESGRFDAKVSRVKKDLDQLSQLLSLVRNFDEPQAKA